MYIYIFIYFFDELKGIKAQKVHVGSQMTAVEEWCVCG